MEIDIHKPHWINLPTGGAALAGMKLVSVLVRPDKKGGFQAAIKRGSTPANFDDAAHIPTLEGAKIEGEVLLRRALTEELQNLKEFMK